MVNWKNVGAVAAGFVSVAVLSVATDAVLEQAGIFPPIGSNVRLSTGLLLLAFFYRSVYAVIGGFLAARISSTRPERQVMVLGILGTIGGTAGVIFGWNLSDHWYPIALAVTAYPLTRLGGTFGSRSTN